MKKLRHCHPMYSRDRYSMLSEVDISDNRKSSSSVIIIADDHHRRWLSPLANAAGLRRWSSLFRVDSHV